MFRWFGRLFLLLLLVTMLTLLLRFTLIPFVVVSSLTQFSLRSRRCVGLVEGGVVSEV